MALATAAQIIAAVSTRNIDAGHFLPAEINIAERDYVLDALGLELYSAVVADSASYASFISTYILPVLAYGTLSNVWNRLGVEVTDRGVNRFTGEGITTAPDTDKTATLFEIRQRLSSAIGAMIDYADENYPDLFDSDIDYQYKEITYYSQGTKRVNAL